MPRWPPGEDRRPAHTSVEASSLTFARRYTDQTVMEPRQPTLASLAGRRLGRGLILAVLLASALPAAAQAKLVRIGSPLSVAATLFGASGLGGTCV